MFPMGKNRKQIELLDPECVFYYIAMLSKSRSGLRRKI